MHNLDWKCCHVVWASVREPLTQLGPFWWLSHTVHRFDCGSTMVETATFYFKTDSFHSLIPSYRSHLVPLLFEARIHRRFEYLIFHAPSPSHSCLFLYAKFFNPKSLSHQHLISKPQILYFVEANAEDENRKGGRKNLLWLFRLHACYIYRHWRRIGECYWWLWGLLQCSPT